MQCFRCGKELDGYTCQGCGGALELGEDLCRMCGTPVLCASCAGATAYPAAEAMVMPAAAPGGAPQITEPLQYEYVSVQIPICRRYDDESYGHYAQRVQQLLTEQTLQAAMEGWQTVDPLDYRWLQHHGFVQHGLLFIGRPSVTLRLKRLVRA